MHNQHLRNNERIDLIIKYLFSSLKLRFLFRIEVNLEDDPEFYCSLSLRLRDIIEKTVGN